MRNTALRSTAVALFLVAGLAACSGESSDTAQPQDGPSVASLTTQSAETVAAQEPDSGQPRERFGMTDAELEALQQPYLNCMKENGVDVLGDRQAAKDSDQAQQANAKCENLLPLPAWERDSSNPEARDFARDVLACLKEKGVEYVEVSQDGVSLAYGGKDNDQRSVTMGLELTPECEREVVAAK
ncbi:hypothetical protein [Kineosporia babensis]|uniref:Secreted protein n=1 Tax=Kineosporia babensis TaxID=499548 RepID=A0A9X1NMD0_9ACTN|nr:hypothetical protein [Kineosporia babensis]MCD5316219.1 hypothetical protein [Kineosporia babensis]